MTSKTWKAFDVLLLLDSPSSHAGEGLKEEALTSLSDTPSSTPNASQSHSWCVQWHFFLIETTHKQTGYLASFSSRKNHQHIYHIQSLRSGEKGCVISEFAFHVVLGCRGAPTGAEVYF